MECSSEDRLARSLGASDREPQRVVQNGLAPRSIFTILATRAMPMFRLRDFSLLLNLPAQDDLRSPADRQCTWRVFVALARRPVLVGWRRRPKQPPAGALSELETLAAGLSEALTQLSMAESTPASSTIADFVTRTLAFVIGPFLEKWGSEPGPSPEVAAFEADLASVLAFLRDTAAEMTEEYSFPDVVNGRPPGLETAWLEGPV